MSECRYQMTALKFQRLLMTKSALQPILCWFRRGATAPESTPCDSHPIVDLPFSLSVKPGWNEMFFKVDVNVLSFYLFFINMYNYVN